MSTASENARFMIVAEDAQQVERWLRPALQHLVRNDFPVHLCLPAPEELEGFEILPLPPATGLTPVDIGLRASVLASRIASLRPDVLVCLGPNAALSGLPLARHLRVPNVALWLPDGVSRDAGSAPRRWRGRGIGLLDPLHRGLERGRAEVRGRLLPAADLLILPEVTALASAEGQLALPLAPGVDLETFHAEAGRDAGGRQARARLGLREARHVLGVHVPDAAALDAWRDLQDALGVSRGGLRVLLMAPPELPVRPEDASARLDRPLAPDALDACDLLFVPGADRASLEVALSAMAMRVPVLAMEGTPVGTQVMALGGGVALAPDELHQGVGELLTDPQLRARLGARGQLRVRSEASREGIARQVLGAFEALVRRKYGEPLHLTQDGTLLGESAIARRRRDLMQER